MYYQSSSQCVSDSRQGAFTSLHANRSALHNPYTWAAQSGVSRPKISPGRERPTSPDRETQRPVFGRKASFGDENPAKAGDEKSRETGSGRAKTPKTDLWHYGLGHLHRQPWSHSPETGFSKRGLPLFPGFFPVVKISNTKNSEKIV